MGIINRREIVKLLWNFKHSHATDAKLKIPFIDQKLKYTRNYNISRNTFFVFLAQIIPIFIYKKQITLNLIFIFEYPI